MFRFHVQMTPSKDFLVHVVATPASSDEGGDEGDAEPPCKRWLSVDSIDEQYIVNHARQVLFICSYLHDGSFYVFIARHHAVHAECHIVLPIPSVSVCLSDGSIVSKQMEISSRHFDSLLRHQIFFLNPTTFTKFQYEPP